MVLTYCAQSGENGQSFQNKADSHSGSSRTVIPFQNVHPFRSKTDTFLIFVPLTFKKWKIASNPIDMRERSELLRLHFKQKLIGLQDAKVGGNGKTAASEYIEGFKNSGLDISVISRMSDSELIRLINIRKQTQNPQF